MPIGVELVQQAMHDRSKGFVQLLEPTRLIWNALMLPGKAAALIGPMWLLLGGGESPVFRLPF
jgi:hypothetical protein